MVGLLGEVELGGFAVTYQISTFLFMVSDFQNHIFTFWKIYDKIIIQQLPNLSYRNISKHQRRRISIMASFIRHYEHMTLRRVLSLINNQWCWWHFWTSFEYRRLIDDNNMCEKWFPFPKSLHISRLTPWTVYLFHEPSHDRTYITQLALLMYFFSRPTPNARGFFMTNHKIPPTLIINEQSITITPRQRNNKCTGGLDNF